MEDERTEGHFEGLQFVTRRNWIEGLEELDSYDISGAIETEWDSLSRTSLMVISQWPYRYLDTPSHFIYTLWPSSSHIKFRLRCNDAQLSLEVEPSIVVTTHYLGLDFVSEGRKRKFDVTQPHLGSIWHCDMQILTVLRVEGCC